MQQLIFRKFPENAAQGSPHINYQLLRDIVFQTTTNLSAQADPG